MKSTLEVNIQFKSLPVLATLITPSNGIAL
jgi:hypothetical protein